MTDVTLIELVSLRRRSRVVETRAAPAAAVSEESELRDDQYPAFDVEHGAVHLAGGVSANQLLRHMTREKLPDKLPVFWPVEQIFCTDNAAMIAAAGHFQLKSQPSSSSLDEIGRAHV